MASGFTLSRRGQSTLIWLIYIVGFIPAAWEFYLGATNQLGADPIKTFEHDLGLWAIRFLILTLLVTPIRDLFGQNFIRYRRALGLLCFWYALMHFLVYMILDQDMMLNAVLQDVLERPFIMFGMAGLVLLLALAVTSNSFSIRRMGKNWIWLHRAIYIVAGLGAIHYALSTKLLDGEQYFYITLLLLMIAYRSYRPILMQQRRAAKRSPARKAA